MIYIFLADGFEEVEAFTPLDYLRRCEELEVKTVGTGGKMVTGAHGITVIADCTFFDIVNDKIEMIVLPGGMPGTLNLEKSDKLQEIIDYCVDKEIPIGAICAAPSILGHKGILDGKAAACYVGFEGQLGQADVKESTVVVDGNIITSRGAGTANQFAFALIEKLLGAAKMQKIKDSVLWDA